MALDPELAQAIREEFGHRHYFWKGRATAAPTNRIVLPETPLGGWALAYGFPTAHIQASPGDLIQIEPTFEFSNEGTDVVVTTNLAIVDEQGSILRLVETAPANFSNSLQNPVESSVMSDYWSREYRLWHTVARDSDLQNGCIRFGIAYADFKPRGADSYAYIWDSDYYMSSWHLTNMRKPLDISFNNRASASSKIALPR